MEVLTAAGGVVTVLVFVLIILAILMPVFIYEICTYTRRIKKEIIQLNQTLSLINSNVKLAVEDFTFFIKSQGTISFVKCSWCQQSFPEPQVTKRQDITLCPICAKKADQTPDILKSPLLSRR